MAADPPWSGKSEAIRTEASPPPVRTGPQVAAGSAWTRDSFGPGPGVPVTLTQTPPAPAERLWGVPATSITRVTVFVLGSIRDTVPRNGFEAQTAPLPTEMPVTPIPTAIVRVTGLGSGSTRQTVPSTGSVAQTAPAPTAIPFKLLAPSEIRCSAWSVRVSMRMSVEAPSSTQTE